MARLSLALLLCTALWSDSVAANTNDAPDECLKMKCLPWRCLVKPYCAAILISSRSAFLIVLRTGLAGEHICNSVVDAWQCKLDRLLDCRRGVDRRRMPARLLWRRSLREGRWRGKVEIDAWERARLISTIPSWPDLVKQYKAGRTEIKNSEQRCCFYDD